MKAETSSFNQVKAIKKTVTLPVGVKLTPTTADMVPMALSAKY
jgi:dihydroorotate dehydrogenase